MPGGMESALLALRLTHLTPFICTRGDDVPPAVKHGSN